MNHIYPIGTAGQPWGSAEKQQWRATAKKQRDYASDVISQLEALPSPWVVESYGELNYDEQHYPLYVIRNADVQPDKPTVLITGGVHGYERSGIHGALRFIQTVAANYLSSVNLLIFPCISPWGYETVNRWTPHAIDPNRSFFPNSPAAECAQVMAYLAQYSQPIIAHIDLHETTNTDESEFRPALAARDGKPFIAGEIPDGFYLVADSPRLKSSFQTAILQEVAKVTHIAPADNKGCLIDEPIVQPGLIALPMKRLGLSGNLTNAPYHTTTEVYPDSPQVTDAQCDTAQVAAIVGALDYLLQQDLTPFT